MPTETPADLVHLKAPLDASRTEAEGMRTALLAFTITTQEQKQAVALAMQDAAQKRKAIEAQEKAFSQPIKSRLDATHEIYRASKAAWKAIEDLLKSKLHDYEVSSALAIADATERAAQFAAAGDSTGAHAALVAAGAPTADAAGMQIRHPWTFDVINQDLLPREYLLPNYKAIQAYMRTELAKPGSTDEAPVLPGVKFYRELTVAAAPKR